MFRQFIIIGLSLACFAQVAHFMPSSTVARDVPEGETDTASAGGAESGGVMGVVNDAKAVGTNLADQVVMGANQLLIANARLLNALFGALGSTKNGVFRTTSMATNGIAGGYDYLNNALQSVPVVSTASSGVKQVLDQTAGTLDKVTKFSATEVTNMFKTLQDNIDKAVPAGLSTASSQGTADKPAEA